MKNRAKLVKESLNEYNDENTYPKGIDRYNEPDDYEAAEQVYDRVYQYMLENDLSERELKAWIPGLTKEFPGVKPGVVYSAAWEAYDDAKTFS